MVAALELYLEFLPVPATVVGASVTDHANGIAPRYLPSPERSSKAGSG